LVSLCLTKILELCPCDHHKPNKFLTCSLTFRRQENVNVLVQPRCHSNQNASTVYGTDNDIFRPTDFDNV
jgi:hypothetical protein